MMNAHVNPQQTLNFRGRSLLAFVLEPTAPLADWFAGLDSWLVRSPTFFAAKPVILEMAGLDVTLKEYRDLIGALARRHIRVMAVENAARALVGPHLPPVVTGGRATSAPAHDEPEAEAAPVAIAPQAAKPPPAETLVIDGALRSGQSIMHAEGDVIVVGRVASGAEIVAGGSVHVYGALHGRVIAGISGSTSARIFCREARAELLCIGGAYMTAETLDPAFEGRCLEVRLVGEELKLRALD
ncbi:MAG TPA: septum site-determining protein MinC [Roseiarcus sp.]|nr:septum site-determining protein MinC [Roseiarcus sp.]